MKRKATKRNSNFVLRIKALPDDAKLITKTEDGTRIFVDKFGTLLAERTEVVYYRILQARAPNA